MCRLPLRISVVAACGVAFVVLSTVRRAPLVADAQAALLYVANWRFLLQKNDYFGAADVDSSLFLHFWSLSIEEQFYVVFPILLIVLWRAERRRRGVLVGVLGLLFAGSLRKFATDGEGTLAPWDPPRRLVVSGLYRYVRNPMISGVLFVVTGEALVLWSRPLAVWALTFLLLNAVYIPVLEEPMLAQRFGEPYREYCRNVRRFLPRLTPWVPPA
jgi:peptidoglycan/LPS O-acetylase OafA/YrhL